MKKADKSKSKSKPNAKGKTAGKYSEDDVSYFETDLQKIRAKPQMFIGPTDDAGIFTIVREPCDNGVDEARAGRNKLVHVFVTTKDFWVVDAGVGIPVKKHAKAKVSTFTHVLTALQSSGKMSGDAYKSAIGCFVGETKVALVDGREVDMKTLYQERLDGLINYVWAIDRKTGQIRPQPIDRVLLTGYTKKLVDLAFGNGATIRCTPNHPLFSTGLEKIEAEKSLHANLIHVNLDSETLPKMLIDAEAYLGESVAKLPSRFTPNPEERLLAFDIVRNAARSICDIINLTAENLDDHITDKSYSSEVLCQVVDLEEFVSALYFGMCPTLCLYEDLSEYAKAQRLKKFNYDKTERSKVNHLSIRPESIKYVELDEEVPIYDLSVGHDHNYLLACGIFVGNTHGVGLKATNALSSSFEAWTYRADAGGWHYTMFESGVEKVAVKKVAKGPKLPDGKTAKLGTVIRFTPDTKIFLKAKLNPTQLKTWCEMTAYMNAGLKIALTGPSGKTQEWLSKLGIIEYLDKRLADLKATALNKKPLFHTSSTLELAISFADVEGSEVQFFTNTIRNIDEGFHAESFYKALAKSLDPYKGKLVYTPSDLKEGLVGILNYKIDAPQFSSQTKEKLVDVRMKEPCYAECLEVLSEYWKNNKTLAKEIVTRAAELRKKTSDFLKDKKLIKNVKGATKALSTKMADVTNNKIPFSERELYLVEGDSAGGCHFGDVRVKLVDGTTKSFEELVADFAKGIDHRGWAYDRTNKVPVPFTFFHPRITKHVTEYIEMELADGTVWRGTVDHPWLLTNGTYKAAGQLTPDDEIQEVQP